MAKRRYGEKNSNSFFRWIYFVLFGMISIWLIISIFNKKSPSDVLKSVFTKLPTSNVGTPDSTLILQKDSIIKSLSLQLSQCRGEASYSRAIVIIDSQTLNLRAKPSLSAEILLKNSSQFRS